jgi:hypothetical protein
MRCAVGCILIVFLIFPVVSNAGVNNVLYATILEAHVKDGLVDYENLVERRENLDAYLDMMGNISPDDLTTDEQLAFFINLYNAATLRLVLDNYPVDGIKDIGSFFSSPWKLKVVKLSREMVTLDHIEHEIVRPRFKDPRVHMALNCSAMSCPPLLSVPYEAETIDAQLEQATIDFINDEKSNYLAGNKLYVSKIFNWFSEDFPDDFTGWFMLYAQGNLKSELQALIEAGKKPRITYIKYDWDLNRLGR